MNGNLMFIFFGVQQKFFDPMVYECVHQSKGRWKDIFNIAMLEPHKDSTEEIHMLLCQFLSPLSDSTNHLLTCHRVDFLCVDSLGGSSIALLR